MEDINQMINVNLNIKQQRMTKIAFWIKLWFKKTNFFNNGSLLVFAQAIIIV